jgi:hypothetical protein
MFNSLHKKILGYWILITFSLCSFAFAQGAGGAGWWTQWGWSSQSTQYNPQLPWSTEGLKWEWLLASIQRFINYILWFLALIALGVLLWGGFQMVTAAGDDNKYKKGFTILKQAGIGLVIIWLSWFIVSFFFWIVSVMTWS